jgi:hypothetical protein
MTFSTREAVHTKALPRVRRWFRYPQLRHFKSFVQRTHVSGDELSSVLQAFQSPENEAWITTPPRQCFEGDN